MRIGVNLVQYIDVQGIEIFARDLLNAFKDITDYELVFFVNEKSKNIFAMDGVTIVNVPLRNFSKTRRIFFQQFFLSQILRKNNVDILLCPSLAMPLWYKNKVVVLHDCAWKHFKEEAGVLSRIYLWLTTLSIKYRSLGSVAISNFSRIEFEKLFGIYTKTVIYEGPPHVLIASDSDMKAVEKKFDFLFNKQPYLFFIGNFHHRKNLVNAIRAFKKFLDTHPNYLFVCAGKRDGYEYNYIYKLSQQLCISDQVKFIGFVDEIEKSVLYKNATALVFPSLYEGFGLPILEAQSLGVPVLTSQTSSLPEVAGDGAVFVDPVSPDSIYKGMKLIVSDYLLRENLVKKGYTNLQRFSWVKSAHILNDFFHTLNSS